MLLRPVAEDLGKENGMFLVVSHETQVFGVIAASQDLLAELATPHLGARLIDSTRAKT